MTETPARSPEDTPAAPPRWPPWRAYDDAVAKLGGGAPQVRFEACGPSTMAFIAHFFISVHWAHGVRPRALRRRELDVTVACDGEEAPKRRASWPPSRVAAASDAIVDAPPAGAMVLSQCEYHFFPLRSGAAAVVLFKRAVPRSTGATMSAVRRAGNAATLVLAATAPLRCAVRRLSKPRVVAVAVLPLAALREAARRGEDTRQVRTLQLDVLACPRHLQLASTAQLLQLFERHCAEPGEEFAAVTSRPRPACASLTDALRHLACGRSGGGDVAGVRDEHGRNFARIGSVCVSVSLDYVRGTSDGGGYDGPERMRVLSAPGLRPAKALLANHWICSHQNVYTIVTPEERAALSPEQLAARTPRLFCYFNYGLLGGGAARVGVHFFGQQRGESPQADEFRYGGRILTDNRGYVDVAAPADMEAGHYAIRAVVEGDHTTGAGSIFLLRSGTPCVLLDLDGTLNIGDEMMVEQTTLDAVPTLARRFDAVPQKGVLSGGFYNHTRSWLVAHGFPPGPIALTEFTLLAALPGKGKALGVELVGAFKRRYQAGLLDAGVTFAAAYGNTATDIFSYSDVLPLEKIFISGPHAGEGGTRPVHDWAQHADELWRTLPMASPPIPYVNLHW